MLYLNPQTNERAPLYSLEGVPGWTVMDFVGLQDADGRDIYEGDIVSAYELDFPDVGTAEVVWDEATAAFVVIGGADDETISFAELHLPRTRVIGNRYENKDLLEISDAAE